MAFTVSEDHARQEQVGKRWRSPTAGTLIKSGRCSRRTSSARMTPAPSSWGWRPITRRAASSSTISFTDDRGGWLQDVALLDRLAGEKVETRGRGRQRRGSLLLRARRFHQAMTVGCVACGASHLTD